MHRSNVSVIPAGLLQNCPNLVYFKMRDARVRIVGRSWADNQVLDLATSAIDLQGNPSVCRLSETSFNGRKNLTCECASGLHGGSDRCARKERKKGRIKI
jgi:hypothetical protein